MAFAREELCQVSAHCACTCYDDFHFLGILGICSGTDPYRGGRAVISTPIYNKECPIYNKECQGLGRGLYLGKDFRNGRFHTLTVHAKQMVEFLGLAVLHKFVGHAQTLQSGHMTLLTEVFKDGTAHAACHYAVF